MLLAPAAAGADSGASEWPTPGGSSSWSTQQPAESVDPALPGAEADAEQPNDPPSGEPALKAPPAQPIVLAAVDGIAFPVAGPASYSASFGAPRSDGRTHEGVDIFAEKMTPVMAAASGTVSFVRNGIGSDCCVVKIRHDDGQSSLYLHLNNDTAGTDDGQGYGIAEGIEAGVRVGAGYVIGYVGDSGTAEETPSHLHFELHDPAGTELDPYPYLQIAQAVEPALFLSALVGQPETLPDTGLPVGNLLLVSLGLLAGGLTISRNRR